MGITSHTHMHKHKYTQKMFLLHGEEKWMDGTGRRRTQWRHTCFLLHLLPSLSAIFFHSHSRLHDKLCSPWGGIMLSRPRRVFPAHQRSDTTHSAGFPTPAASSFFHEFWSKCIHRTTTWTVDPYSERNGTLSKDLDISVFFYLFRLDQQIKTESFIRFSGGRVLQRWVISNK